MCCPEKSVAWNVHLKWPFQITYCWLLTLLHYHSVALYDNKCKNHNNNNYSAFSMGVFRLVWLVCFVAFLFRCSVCATNQTLPFDPAPIWTFVDFGTSLQPFWFLTWFSAHSYRSSSSRDHQKIHCIHWFVYDPLWTHRVLINIFLESHLVYILSVQMNVELYWPCLTTPKTFLSSLTSDIMKYTQFVHVNTGLFVWILQQLFKVHVIKISPISFCLAKHVAAVVPKPWHAVISTELPFTQVQK